MTDLKVVSDKAEKFQALHKTGDPLILFNSWDVMTAQITARSFPAVATSSGAIASSQGFDDGENTPVELVMSLVHRITKAVDCPVTVDFEAGYSDDPNSVADAVERLMEAGAVGINLEDSLSRGQRGLVDPAVHGRKIEAIRTRAERLSVPLFINARTDAFLLKIGDLHECLAETLSRASCYEGCGASGIFVPGLIDLDAISRLTETIGLPINIMAEPDAPTLRALTAAGVARISFGGWPITSFASAFGAAAQRLAETNDYAALSFGDE